MFDFFRNVARELGGGSVKKAPVAEPVAEPTEPEKDHGFLPVAARKWITFGVVIYLLMVVPSIVLTFARGIETDLPVSTILSVLMVLDAVATEICLMKCKKKWDIAAIVFCVLFFVMQYLHNICLGLMLSA